MSRCDVGLRPYKCKYEDYAFIPFRGAIPRIRLL